MESLAAQFNTMTPTLWVFAAFGLSVIGVINPRSGFAAVLYSLALTWVLIQVR